jgi:hypothetical protein
MASWLKIIGLVASGGVAGLLVGAVIYLSVDALQKRLKEKYPQATIAKIEKIYKSGMYNTIKAGIYDDNDSKIGVEEIKVKDYDKKTIRKGATLYLTA